MLNNYIIILLYVSIYLTPISPIIPIAIPAAKPENPQANPKPKCAYPLNRVYVPFNYTI